MALTRKFLKALNVDDAVIEEIITAHTEVTDALKTEQNELKAKLEKAAELEKQLETLKKDIGEKYVEKSTYEKAVKDLADFKADVSSKEKAAAVDKAVRSYLSENKITGNNADIAVMAMSDIIKSLELDGEKIKDTKAIDDLISGKFKAMQDGETKVIYKNVGTPPANNGAPEPKHSRAAELANQFHSTMFGGAQTNDTTKGA